MCRARHAGTAVRILLFLWLCFFPACISAGCAEPVLVEDGYTGDTRITFLGDCTLGSVYSKRNVQAGFVRTIAENGLAYPFSCLRDMTGNDDLTVGNLEGVLSDRKLERVRKTYNFIGATEYTQILTDGSVECVTLANNHTHDYGDKGYADTKDALENAGIAWFDAENAYIWEDPRGVRIGFLGVNYSLSGNRATRYAAMAQELREKGCACVITVMHAGDEYQLKTSAYQAQIVSLAAENGSCLVVGHHPHVVQGYAEVSGMPVVYSLGNCVFGGSIHVRDPNALVLQAVLHWESGVLQSMDLHFYPIRVTTDASYNNYCPCFLSGEAAQQVLKRMEASTGISVGVWEDGEGAVVHVDAPDGGWGPAMAE
ncbi:MAG: CapA family protein [Clostridia bacterium]|nr:CapA family protein [Clostridia bacterium]